MFTFEQGLTRDDEVKRRMVLDECNLSTMKLLHHVHGDVVSSSIEHVDGVGVLARDGYATDGIAAG